MKRIFKHYARMSQFVPASAADYAVHGFVCGMCVRVCRLAHAADAPKRVLSFNLCADQLVVALADPEQIAGLSPYATDPRCRWLPTRPGILKKVDWQAESTILLQPDLVLVGPNETAR